MKFIEQKRIHIPAKTEFIQRKFLDIPYAQGRRKAYSGYLSAKRGRRTISGYY